mmetsp:Transcript_20209/g.43315  ORF Transcript_20209/g.43315 Transcript_20209/m.43315 type:complete len:140 (+) Transcript_20209:47-466(+)
MPTIMPSSNQNPVGNSKAAKFVASNPLAPLADPFAGMGDDEKELHKEVSDDVQQRLEKAMKELKEKHRTGTNEVDDADRAPTGAAYKQLHRHQREQARAAALFLEKDQKTEKEKPLPPRLTSKGPELSANAGIEHLVTC